MIGVVVVVVVVVVAQSRFTFRPGVGNMQPKQALSKVIHTSVGSLLA